MQTFMLATANAFWGASSHAASFHESHPDALQLGPNVEAQAKPQAHSITVTALSAMDERSSHVFVKRTQ